MKVAISTKGPFDLTNINLKKLYELDQNLVSKSGINPDQYYFRDIPFDVMDKASTGNDTNWELMAEARKKTRTNPILISFIEGLKADDPDFETVKVVVIPFDSLDGWRIYVTDFEEWIAENHRTWS